VLLGLSTKLGPTLATLRLLLVWNTVLTLFHSKHSMRDSVSTVRNASGVSADGKAACYPD